MSNKLPASLQPCTLHPDRKTDENPPRNLFGNKGVAIGSEIDPSEPVFVSWGRLWTSNAMDSALRDKIYRELGEAGVPVSEYPSKLHADGIGEGTMIGFSEPKPGSLPREKMKDALRVLARNGVIPETDIERVASILVPDAVKNYLESKEGGRIQLLLSRDASTVRITTSSPQAAKTVYDDCFPLEPGMERDPEAKVFDCQIVVSCKDPSSAARKFRTIESNLNRYYRQSIAAGLSS